MKKKKEFKQITKKKFSTERERRLYNTYGITGQEWSAIYAVQLGVCAICEKAPKVTTMLNVDHRHVKNYKKLPPEEKRKEVRGLLCMFCNKWVVGSIEHSKTPRQILENLVEYFEHYKLKNDPEEIVLKEVLK